MIELEDVHKSVRLPGGEGLDILQGASLRVAAGEVVAIVGRSGSGKTTLLNVIGLLDRAHRGRYRVNGVDVGTLSDAKLSALRGATFGFVFQNFMLLESRSALSNVAAPLAHASASEFRRRDRLANDLLTRVGLANRARSFPSQLSGGEQQRVAIARALVRQPACILADEPTGSLDLGTAAVVLELLFRQAREAGAALILVTHDPEVAKRADRAVRLTNGTLTAVMN